MLDLGWSELLIIGVAALIVVGPKDLPRMLRTLGQYAGKARSIAREFQRSMDEAARQADIDELKEVKKDLDSMRQEQYKLQREMSQSFMDSPKKTKGATAEAAKPAAAETPAAAAAPAPAEPAKAPAAAKAAAPTEQAAASKPKAGDAGAA